MAVKKNEPQSIGNNFDPLKDKFVSREFQKYGYDLALELGDLDHKSLYFRLAKNYPRTVLEKARSFVKDANARSKAKLFMWKVGQMKKEQESKGAEK